ncbi:MAG TPA: SgcJ/EcaC family oxidoreductase [Patescibacteria group bacterium]|nr:SgcJ/EcaC family oxidoreductase [Patescibacteria group bacterium]
MSLIDIGKVNRMFEDAVRAQDPERLASLYTGNAMALPPDGPIVRGQDGVRQLWSTVIKDMGLRDITLKTVDLDVDVDGDTACEVGQATLSLAPPGGQRATVSVKYVVVWQRSAGQWRLHRDIWNAQPA